MIQVIAGNKGSGKTKRLLDVANEAIKSEHGLVVFIDDDKRYMYDLRHEIRFVDAGEFAATQNCTSEVFLGFLSGMLSVNYDISLVCVDAFLKITKATALEDTKDFFDKLDALSEKSGCSFVISISRDINELPDYITRYIEK